MSYDEMREYLDMFTEDLLVTSERMLEVIQVNLDGIKIRDISEIDMTEYELYVH